MKLIKPKRVRHSFTQHLQATPERVFPLLCPVREAEWIRGWDPLLVVSESGFVERDCAFITSSPSSSSVWYVTRHQPADLFVEMIKLTPGVTACRLAIQVCPAAGGSTAEITYMHTSLGPEGDLFVEAFTPEYYSKFMRDWEARMNHYLRTGAMMAEP